MKKISLIMATAGLCLLLSGYLYASESDRASFYFVFGVVNFCIFLTLLYFFAWPGLKEFFKKRSSTVENEIKEIAAEKSRALETYESLNTRLAKISGEISALTEEAKTNGEKFKQQIVSHATERSEQIIRETRLLAERETALAREKLKKDLTFEALALAEKKIKSRLGKAEHSRLIDFSIHELERI